MLLFNYHCKLNMVSVIFRAVLFVSVFLGILYFILSIWIHNKQSNNEPISDSVTNTAFWSSVVLLIWYIGVLIWIFATFLLDKNVMQKVGDVGAALIEQNGSDFSTSDVAMNRINALPSINSTIKRRTLQEIEDL